MVPKGVDGEKWEQYVVFASIIGGLEARRFGRAVSVTFQRGLAVARAHNSCKDSECVNRSLNAK